MPSEPIVTTTSNIITKHANFSLAGGDVLQLQKNGVDFDKDITVPADKTAKVYLKIIVELS